MTESLSAGYELTGIGGGCTSSGATGTVTVAAGETLTCTFKSVDSGMFVDIGDSMFDADILWLAGEGITRGCNTVGDWFCPNGFVTRGQMAAFLHRALG
ncbi:MAG: S-layer homology domain-containing protein [Acidobacteria bacterium]|nr:S-layer homology domain-containing protein [Acidobacteriota bacterium]